jgi:nucleoside diphosphate kinase
VTTLWTAGPAQRSLVMLKPDGLERGLAGTVHEVLARMGLRVVRRVELRLTAADVRRLDHSGLRTGTPLQFAVTCQYLTRGPVEAWLVEGPDAIGRTLVVKSLIRANFGDTDLGNVMHSANDDAEAVAQAAVLFAADRFPDSAEAADPDRVEYVPLVRRAVRAAGVVPAPIAEPELCGVYLHDHNCLTVDETVAGLMRALPRLGFDDAVHHAIAAKAHGRVEVFAGSVAAAARANLALDGAGLWVTYRAPAVLAGLGPTSSG